MPVEPAYVAHGHRNLPHAPPTGAHLPGARSVVEHNLRHRGRVPHVPSPTAQLANRPVRRSTGVARPLAQRCDELVAKFDDLQRVALRRENNARIGVEDSADRQLVGLVQVQVAQRGWNPGSDRFSFNRLGRHKERVEILAIELARAQTQLLQMLRQGQQGLSMGGGHLSPSEVERTKGRRQTREKCLHILLLQEPGSGGVSQQVQKHQRVADGWVGRQKLDDSRAPQARASGDAEMSDLRGLRNREQRILGDLRVGDIEVSEVDQARQKDLESSRGKTATFMQGNPSQVRQGQGDTRTGDQGLQEESGEGLGRAAAEIHGGQVGKTGEQLAKHIQADITLDMLLQQAFLKVGQQFQALQKRLGGKILDLSVHLLGATQSNRRKVRKVKAANQRAQCGIARDVVEGLGENDRVGECHVPVQHTEGGGVQCL